MNIKLKDKVIYLGKPMIVTNIDSVNLPNRAQLTDVNGDIHTVYEYELDELQTLDQYKKSQMTKIIIIFTISFLIYCIFDSWLAIFGLVFIGITLRSTLKSIKDYFNL